MYKIAFRIKLGFRNSCLRREAVDHVSISDQNQIQPSATSPPARCYSELPPSGLKQIPSFLKYNHTALKHHTRRFG